MVKDKDYYTKQIFQGSFYTQCLWDLAGGEIKIYDIPFEYRAGRAYILAKKVIRYEVFGENTQKEKNLLVEQLKNDIIRCKREKKLTPELRDKEADLLSVFDTCIEDEYLQLNKEDDLFWHKYGTEQLFEKLYMFH